MFLHFRVLPKLLVACPKIINARSQITSHISLQ
jgi:hypothetical protein